MTKIFIFIAYLAINYSNIAYKLSNIMRYKNSVLTTVIVLAMDQVHNIFVFAGMIIKLQRQIVSIWFSDSMQNIAYFQ